MFCVLGLQDTGKRWAWAEGTVRKRFGGQYVARVEAHVFRCDCGLWVFENLFKDVQKI